MDTGLAGDDTRGPDLGAALHHLQRIVRDIEDHIGLAELRFAEVARQPAPSRAGRFAPASGRARLQRDPRGEE